MSHALFNVGGLRFWTNAQINTRERVIKQITDTVSDTLVDINQAWKFERVDTPVMVPRSLISAAYSPDDIFMLARQLGGEDYALRAETTAGSYLMAEHMLKTTRTKPPLCVWQAGQSFRVEPLDGASPSRLRFNSFYQLEFQMIYSEDTKADYVSPLIESLTALVTDLTGIETRIVDSDRLPSYSERTQDIEVLIPDRYETLNPGWREVASMSNRTDFPEIPTMKKMKVFEVAFGLDRMVSIIHKELKEFSSLRNKYYFKRRVDMKNSMRSFQKLKTPGTSTTLDYVVNIYKHGEFLVAYRYKGWSGEAVADEVKILQSRFPDYRGYRLEW